MIIKITKRFKIHFSMDGIRIYVNLNNGKWISFTLTKRELQFLEFILNVVKDNE